MLNNPYNSKMIKLVTYRKGENDTNRGFKVEHPTPEILVFPGDVFKCTR